MIPELMASAGNITQLKTEEGFVIEVGMMYQASLPVKDDARRSKALAWLRRFYPDLLKHEVSINFKKGLTEQAKKAVEVLKKAGFKDVVDEETVHHATLTAFYKETQEQKRKFPAHLFTTYSGLRATVKLPKAKKEK